jgi:hypothetical protein
MVLPSWRKSAARDAIHHFIESVTDPTSSGYVEPGDRIAVFDNDGTLWAEQPIYPQTLYSIDRLRKRGDLDPALLQEQPFAGARDGDFDAISRTGIPGHLRLFAEATAGMGYGELAADVREWFATATNPDSGALLSSLVYQPMCELLDLLRQHEFTCWMITGSSGEFLRICGPDLYGIPPERIVGSEISLTVEHGDRVPKVVRGRELSLINDGPEKIASIIRHIGQRPIAAFGNSDGDLPMLEWVTAGDRSRLGVLIHHTDVDREWSYDRHSDIGRLHRGLALQPDHPVLRLDMARDWDRIFTS